MTVRMGRRQMLTAVAALLVLAAAGCGSDPGGTSSGNGEKQMLPIRVGWQPDPNAPLYLAREKGLFEKNGLNPTFSTFQAAPPMFSALKAGAVDVADMGTVPYTIALSQGIDLRALMVGVDVSSTNALVVHDGVTSFADLRGKRVAVTKGASPYLLLQRLLSQNDMTMSDIKLVDMQVGQMIPAWENGDVDAVLAWSPWIFQFKGGDVIETMADNGLYAPQFWAARTDFTTSNSEATQRFVTTMLQAIQMIKDDQSAAIEAMAKQLSIDQDLSAKLLEENVYPNADEQASQDYVLSIVEAQDGKGAGKAAQDIADRLKDNGFISNNPDVAQTFDASFLEKAAKKE